MCIGGSVAPPPAKTQQQIAEETDNPYENPNSGTEAPNWKLTAAKAPGDAQDPAEHIVGGVLEQEKQQSSDRYG